jgi:beta-lactamase regulating signal transducer with metallopeptidase domain
VISLQAIAEIFVAHMLNSVLAGIGLVLAAEIGLRLAGSKNSATRFMVWFAMLAAVVLLPILGFAGASGQGQGTSSGLVLSSRWAWGGLAAWGFIAAINLIRLGFGLAHVWKIRQDCEAVDASLVDSGLSDELAQFGSRRRVQLCVSDQVSTPTAIGLFRPAVVIPRWAMVELSPSELNTVVLHELAHLERWDDWTNLLQKVCKALFFFHPAVWWIESKLGLEREMACDDFVLAQTGNAHAYAECLVHLAERSFLRRGLALAQAAVSRVKDTSLRVMQILSKDRVNTGKQINWIPAAGLATVLAVAAGGVAAHAPSLISFSDPQQTVNVASSMANADAGMNRNWVVPAMATQESMAKLTPRKSTIEARRVRSLHKPTTMPTVEPQPVAAHEQPVMTAPAFMVVMQEQQVGNMTFITWKVTMVEVVFHPTPAQVKAQTPARIT